MPTGLAVIWNGINTDKPSNQQGTFESEGSQL
jgi:hypothetical protein